MSRNGPELNARTERLRVVAAVGFKRVIRDCNHTRSWGDDGISSVRELKDVLSTSVLTSAAELSDGMRINGSILADANDNQVETYPLRTLMN